MEKMVEQQMNSPKIPDNERDWNSIEIFLFSNGKEFSPPRKYHLTADELKAWNGTLNQLARLQYGEDASKINLFSLDGKKIEGPLEMTDGTSYVAVKDYDEFTQAGYNRHLMKASRSWEKRQERKKHQCPNMKSGEKCKSKIVNSQKQRPNKPPASSKIKNLKKIEENAISIDKQPPNNNLTRRQSAIPKDNHPKLTKEINELRESERVSDSVVAVTKQDSIETIHLNEYATNTDIKGQSISSKFDYPNSITRIPEKQQDHFCSENKAESRIFSDKKAGDDSENKPSNDDTETVVKENNRPFANYVPKHSVSIDENPKVITPMKNNEYINDRKYSKVKTGDGIETIHLNQYITNNKSENNIANETISDNTINTNHDRIQRRYDEFVNTASNQKQSNESEINTAAELETNNKSIFKSSITQMDAKQTTRNRSVSVNRHSVIKLTLNINLKDYNNIDKEESQQNLDTKHLNNSSPVHERASQVNIDLNLSGLNLRGSEKGKCPKIMIFRCTCDQLRLDNRFDLYKQEVDSKINTIPATVDENIGESCKCDVEEIRFMKNQTQQLLNALVMGQDLTLPQNTTNHNFISRFENIRSVQNAEINVRNVDVENLLTSEVTEYISNVNENSTMDKFTQTDWCNVVLETRCEPDGHYSFHLPPLRLIKNFRSNSI